MKNREACIWMVLLATTLACASAPDPARAPPPAPRATAPARPPVAASSALDDTLRVDMAVDHAFPWSATRPLTWDDFQGSPASDGSEGAKSAYTLYYAWKCRGETFEFRVIAAFRPRQSWVKAIVLNDGTQRRTVLGHEQTHFDVAELHARRMRQTFGDLAGPCRRTDAELFALAQRLTQDEKTEQRRYDAETNHGLLAAEQAAWSLQTRRRLAASK